MILSYLRTSFRNLFRHRLYTLVNIFGLAVGMAACILVGKPAGACDRILHHQLSGHPRCTRQSS